jgi:hypothetical protein
VYIQVVQPAPPPPSWTCRTFKLGCPPAIAANPDAVASLLTGSPVVRLPSGLSGFVRMPRARQLEMFRPSMLAPRGLGCGDTCKCGGACESGMGQSGEVPVETSGGTAIAPAQAPTPGFFATLTNPLGSDLTVLKQQIDTLNQQTAAVSSSITAGNWGTWLLVGLSGIGLWMVVKGFRGAGRSIGGRVRARRTRSAKRSRLKAELAAL